MIESVWLIPVADTPTAPYQIIFLDKGSSRGLPHVHCQCESPIVASASNMFKSETHPTSINAIGSYAFAPRLTVFKDQSFENALQNYEVFPYSAVRFYVEVASDNPDDIIGAINCTASPRAEVSGLDASSFLTESCAKGAFDTRFHEANSSSVVRLSTRKFEYYNVESIYLSCAVRRCVQEPCGVCAERRLGERGVEAEDEVVTIVKQVRLQNYPMPKATAAVISTAEAWPAPAATFLAPRLTSTKSTQSELLANTEASSLSAMGEHGRNLMSATSNMFDLHVHCLLVVVLLAFVF